jgi:hypothetical protein
MYLLVIVAYKVKTKKSEDDLDYCFYSYVCGPAWTNENLLKGEEVAAKFRIIASEFINN